LRTDGANITAEENKGKKKKFKEGQAEQVLDDLFFEAIKGDHNKHTSASNYLCIALIELYQYLSNQGHHSQRVYTPLMSHQHPKKNC
jgi:predicted HD phosphohydrolase